MDFSRGRHVLPVFRFHLNVGIRLSSKILAPALAIAFTALYLFKLEFFFQMIQAVSLDSHFLLSGLVFSVITILTARTISHRIILGLNGWIRHLPISSPVHRRLAVLSIFTAGFPVLLALMLLVFFLFVELEADPIFYLSGLPVLGLASAQFVLPTRKSFFAKPLAFVACLLAGSGEWILLVLGSVFVFLSDIVSGPLILQKKRRSGHRSRSGIRLIYFLSWRALGVRLFYPYLSGLGVLALTQIFLLNNPLAFPLDAKVILFGGAACVSIFDAVLAHEITLRRPPWPWSRSLPWSSGSRILSDASFIGLHTLPLILVVSFFHWLSIIPLLIALPPLLIYCSIMMRKGYAFRTGAYGRILVFGFLGSLALSLWPWISLLFLASTPILFNWAAGEERNLRVSRWQERHHLAVGDSLSWSRK